MYSRNKVRRAVTAALLLIMVLVTATLITPRLMGNDAGIPPPPSGAGAGTPAQTSSSGCQGSNTASETPPPIGTPATPSGAGAPQPPPPPVPSKAMLKDEALRELWHAYREYNVTLELLSYASSKGVQVGSDAQYFKALAEDLYNKALTAYSSGDYMVAKSYARLSVESMHSLRDIITYELSVKGIAPPPPTSPEGPPPPP